MKSRTVLLVTTLFVCVFVVQAVWPELKGLSEVKVSAVMKQQSPDANPLRDLNEKAKAARGGDPKPVNDFLDDMAARYGLLVLIGNGQETLKERLIRAEINFQKNGLGAVSEKKLARMINALAEQLHAPEFMMTDVRQVRHVRMARMTFLPNLINQQVQKKSDGIDKLKHSSVNPQLSPLEAAFVAMDLIYQKLNSPDFQVTTAEFHANISQRRLDQWRAHQEKKSQGALVTDEDSGKPQHTLTVASPNPASEDLKRAVARAAGMSPAELLNLAHSCLDILGIDR